MMTLTKTIAGRRGDLTTLYSKVGLFPLYEYAVPSHPSFVDEWADAIPEGSTPQKPTHQT